ncbi:MAG TPA: hypothetical protein VMS00_02000 [Acidimicrobiales bacterium]|nr:hypothetical protein [Acidimicrobiales bacterium]
MKHAGAEALEELNGLVTQLRELDWLRETTPGHFYCKSRSIVHFHEDPTGLYADVRLDPQGRFVRMQVNTKVEQDKLVRDIRQSWERNA